MTMHLLGPAYNNIGNTRRYPTARQTRAQAEHDAWLKKQGLHPQQLAAKAHPSRKFTDTVKPQSTGPDCSNGFAPGGAKKTVFDSEWRRDYDHDPALAHRERAAVQRAYELKSRLQPLYSKGPVQLATPGHDHKSGNGRGRNT
tara:strand:+ start:7022 stop:7450 length:429 start_codon:yes stop_codon:yes gene_type:complete